MKLVKRIFAWFSIISIITLFITTIVLAILGYGLSSKLFTGCLYAMIVIPVLYYAFFMLYNRFTKDTK